MTYSSRICCMINQDHGQGPHVEFLCGLLMLLTIGTKSLKISTVVKSSLLLRQQYTHMILINLLHASKGSILHYPKQQQLWIKGRSEQFFISCM